MHSPDLRLLPEQSPPKPQTPKPYILDPKLFATVAASAAPNTSIPTAANTLSMSHRVAMKVIEAVLCLPLLLRFLLMSQALATGLKAGRM